MHFWSPHIFPEKNCSRSARRPARGPESAYRLRTGGEKGVTLIDTLVGVSLMLIVFLGINAAFRLSVDVITNNKARAGALALAGERMEYIRSLTYASVGTSGGIPPGALAQSETRSLNGVTYTRRTVVVYADDPKDGLGASDSNGITTDYKAVKVDVAWTSRLGGTRHVDLTARVSPPTSQGETNPCTYSCAKLVISVVNAISQPVAGASVAITNPSSDPTVNFTTFTDASGTVVLLAAPVASGYGATASNPGYTSDSKSFTMGSGGVSQTLQIDAVSSIVVVTRTYGDGAYITGVPFTLSGATYGYNAVLGGGGSPTTTVSNLKWDTYSMSVAPATGYDLAYSCEPQPILLSPDTSTTTTLYLALHSAVSLAVKVTSNATGALIPAASVHLYKTGYDTTQATDSCGQTYFGALPSGTYNLTVTAPSYTTYNDTNLNVSTSTQKSVFL